MSNILHEGDVGTRITYYCRDGETAVDISSASSTKNLVFKKPGGSIVTKPAIFGDGEGGTGNGSEGILVYVTEAGFLSQTGEWAVQGQVVLGSDARTFTEERFHVHEKL